MSAYLRELADHNKQGPYYAGKLPSKRKHSIPIRLADYVLSTDDNLPTIQCAKRKRLSRAATSANPPHIKRKRLSRAATKDNPPSAKKQRLSGAATKANLPANFARNPVHPNMDVEHLKRSMKVTPPKDKAGELKTPPRTNPSMFLHPVTWSEVSHQTSTVVSNPEQESEEGHCLSLRDNFEATIGNEKTEGFINGSATWIRCGFISFVAKGIQKFLEEVCNLHYLSAAFQDCHSPLFTFSSSYPMARIYRPSNAL
jgi:hypothetical protein